MFAMHDGAFSPVGPGFGSAAEALAWPEPPIGSERCFREDEAPPFPALDNVLLNGQFRAWKGASGKRHIFSVYNARECPAYCYAILIGVALGEQGHRRIFFIGDTGMRPEDTLRNAREASARVGGPVEFHIHLLAQSPSERDAVTADIWGEHAG